MLSAFYLLIARHLMYFSEMCFAQQIVFNKSSLPCIFNLIYVLISKRDFLNNRVAEYPHSDAEIPDLHAKYGQIPELDNSRLKNLNKWNKSINTNMAIITISPSFTYNPLELANVIPLMSPIDLLVLDLT